MVHINNINTVISIYSAYYHLIIKYEKFCGVTLPAMGRFSLYESKSLELCLVYKQETLVDAYWKNYSLYLFRADICCH